MALSLLLSISSLLMVLLYVLYLVVWVVWTVVRGVLRLITFRLVKIPKLPFVAPDFLAAGNTSSVDSSPKPEKKKSGPLGGFHATEAMLLGDQYENPAVRKAARKARDLILWR
jgi:hypothetical protein